MEEDYFFYLSFENSLCKDYITEKFFDAMDHFVVPITFGGALMGQKDNYQTTAGAPKHSFINAYKDFSQDPKGLAEHLKRLMAVPSKYAEYFWWKDFYEQDGNSPMKQYCDICEKLHDPTTPTKVYKNIDDWWVRKAKCGQN